MGTAKEVSDNRKLLVSKCLGKLERLEQSHDKAKDIEAKIQIMRSQWQAASRPLDEKTKKDAWGHMKTGVFCVYLKRNSGYVKLMELR